MESPFDLQDKVLSAIYKLSDNSFHKLEIKKNEG